MYNARGEPVFDFGVAFRSRVFWAPHGRFLLLAVCLFVCLFVCLLACLRGYPSCPFTPLPPPCVQGFSGMSGEMDFWDRNKKTIMGSTSVRSFTAPRSCARFAR